MRKPTQREQMAYSTIARLEAELAQVKAAGGWIKCSDRLPEIGQEVLVFRPTAPASNDPLIRTAFYQGETRARRAFSCWVQPTHWMPLPPLPTA